jgi:hypothetical protein
MDKNIKLTDQENNSGTVASYKVLVEKQGIIIYTNCDISMGNSADLNLYAYDVVAVPNTKEGRALFQPYKEKNHWCGMRVSKQKITVEEFNNLKNKPILLES